jgi:hypothetical protein
MALVTSQVNPIVKAYRTPDVIGLTKCLFSIPDVKKLRRPSRGSIVLKNM